MAGSGESSDECDEEEYYSDLEKRGGTRRGGGGGGRSRSGSSASAAASASAASTSATGATGGSRRSASGVFTAAALSGPWLQDGCHNPMWYFVGTGPNGSYCVTSICGGYAYYFRDGRKNARRVGVVLACRFTGRGPQPSPPSKPSDRRCSRHVRSRSDRSRKSTVRGTNRTSSSLGRLWVGALSWSSGPRCAGHA